VTPTGVRLLAEAAAALAAGDEFAAGARLRSAGHPPDLVATAFTQAELRRRAAGDFSRAAEMLFTRAGLEQSTGEAAARHRAARFAGRGRLADLCTGIGGDLLALAADHPVRAVDRDPLHLRLAAHNAEVYEPAAVLEPVCADVREVDLAGVDGVFVDPARRVDGRRFAAGTCEPPLAWCFGLVDRVEAVAVKAAPGLPLAAVPPGWEIEFVAAGRDLKEAVLFSPALAGASRRATVLLDTPGQVATLVGEPDDVRPADGPGAGAAGVGTGPGTGRGRGRGTARGARGRDAPAGTAGRHPFGAEAGAGGGSGPGGGGVAGIGAPAAYLYDPSPAVTRAGLVGTLAGLVGGWQIDPMIAFLTADEARPTPFARLLRIDASLPFDVRRVAAVLRPMGIGALELRRRGLAGDVDALRRRLLPARRDLVPGGPAVTVMMTRHHDRPWALVCTAVTPSHPAAAPGA
jgi:hypothetical protein